MTLTEADRAALTLAIERACAQDADLAQQIDRMLADSDRLGLSIMQGLAEQLDGTLTVEIHGGTTVRVEFAGA